MWVLFGQGHDADSLDSDQNSVFENLRTEVNLEIVDQFSQEPCKLYYFLQFGLEVVIAEVRTQEIEIFELLDIGLNHLLQVRFGRIHAVFDSCRQ